MLTAFAGEIDPSRACYRCDAKPANSNYLLEGQWTDEQQRQYWDRRTSKCPWRCNYGYYQPPGLDECVPCTPMTADNCKPGHILVPCTSWYDASCSQECSSEALGKPEDRVADDNGTFVGSSSEWVWTTYGGVDAESGEVAIVENPSGGSDGIANAGCMWRCKAGYTLKTMDAGSGDSSSSGLDGGRLSFCVKVQ